MADFNIAIKTVLIEEKGYVNDPEDPGGETKFGISKRMYPDLDIKNLTIEKAEEIYEKDYWQKAYEEIEAQEIVNKTFGVGVDIGMKEANICLQRAVRSAIGTQLTEDGILGQQSISYINECSSITLLAALKSEVAGHYRMINNPHEINGWLNRAYT